MTPSRPTGITILAALAALAGVFGLMLGLGSLSIGAFATGFGLLGTVFGIISIFVGIVLLPLSVLAIVSAYGFWTLKPWAWPLGFGVFLVQLVLGVAMVLTGQFGQIIGVLIDGAILYYLTRPEIKSVFGRS